MLPAEWRDNSINAGEYKQLETFTTLKLWAEEQTFRHNFHSNILASTITATITSETQWWWVYKSLFLLKSCDSGQVYIIRILGAVWWTNTIIFLEEDSVEVACLCHVVLVAAPAGCPLEVDHHLLQLSLNHADTRADSEKNNQTKTFINIINVSRKLHNEDKC